MIYHINKPLKNKKPSESWKFDEWLDYIKKDLLEINKKKFIEMFPSSFANIEKIDNFRTKFNILIKKVFEKLSVKKDNKFIYGKNPKNSLIKLKKLYKTYSQEEIEKIING